MLMLKERYTITWAHFECGKSSYRFAFNGMEKDDEVKGVGNSINFKYRMHDSRLGRFLSVDPLASIYAYNSPYAFAENKLGLGKELEGLELWLFGSSSAISLLRPLIEVTTKVEPSRIPSGGVLPPVVTTPPSALPATPMSTPEIEYFDPSTTAKPDATITAPTVDKGPIILEAKPTTEKENTNPVTDGKYAPPRELPRDENGKPVPESKDPHTQLGRRTSKKTGETYRQAREWSQNGEHKRDIDFTNHNRPKNHENPHQHKIDPETGKRMPAEPLEK